MHSSLILTTKAEREGFGVGWTDLEGIENFFFGYIYIHIYVYMYYTYLQKKLR